jgi:hypothetical protein
MAATTSAAANKTLCLAAVLCLALVVVAAAAATTPGEEGKPMCQVPSNVTDCVQQIKDLNEKNQGKLVSPDCCKELAKQIGCGCLLRNALKDANLLDLQEPFCVKGTACE